MIAKTSAVRPVGQKIFSVADTSRGTMVLNLMAVESLACDVDEGITLRTLSGDVIQVYGSSAKALWDRLTRGMVE